MVLRRPAEALASRSPTTGDGVRSRDEERLRRPRSCVSRRAWIACGREARRACHGTLSARQYTAASLLARRSRGQRCRTKDGGNAPAVSPRALECTPWDQSAPATGFLSVWPMSAGLPRHCGLQGSVGALHEEQRGGGSRGGTK